jgi:hypothetical protein
MMPSDLNWALMHRTANSDHLLKFYDLSESMQDKFQFNGSVCGAIYL